MTKLTLFRRSVTPLLILFLVFIISGCNSSKNQKQYKVAVMQFMHETCTFCPGGDPGIEDWTYNGEPIKDGDLLDGRGSFMGGFVHQSREFNDVELIGLTSPRGVFGGSSRSWNQEEAFNHFVDLMIEDLKEAMPVDGVYLSLHGAMAVRNVPRPEAEIARRFREIVGPNVPIVGTFDLHGNEDKEFLKWADGAYVTKRYPHYDSYIQGERASRDLHSMMKGTYTSTKAVRRPPILTATVLQWTGQSPMMDIMERARRWESREPGARVNVFLGFPWSDVPDVGTSVHVTTNDDQELADEIANDMAEYIWRVREDWAHGEFPQPDEAVRLTRQAIQKGETPVVLGDYWDRPGDATWTLKELIDQNVNGFLYATLTDVHALDKIWEEDMQPGDPFDMEVGGYTGEQAGEPVRITGTIAWRGSRWGYDKVAAVEFGDGNMLLLAPSYQQNRTLQSVTFGPVNPDDYDVFVLKSRVHFRRGFDENGYAKTIYLVDAPGDWFGTVRLDALDYQNVNLEDYYPFGDVEYDPTNE